MTYDPLEWTVRDPLEETVPDPIEREPRLSEGKRRAIEAAALVLLVAGFLTAQWIDDAHQARHYQAQGRPGPEHLTVVPRGGTATLGRVRIKVLGRDTTGAPRSGTTPAGAVNLKLVLQVQPLDARHAREDVDHLTYTVRDRAGHVWSAGGMYDTDRPPAAGTVSQVTVIATVPGRLAGSVVLEVRPMAPAQAGVSQALRFAH
jgi:hypothetical protein